MPIFFPFPLAPFLSLSLPISLSLSLRRFFLSSLASELVVKRCQNDRESLEDRQRPLDVHGESVFARFPKLKENFGLVGGIAVNDKLEVLDTRFSDTTVKVENVRARKLVPDRRLVLQRNCRGEGEKNKKIKIKM